MPAQAVSLYNRAIMSGDYATACRLLTRFGRIDAVHDGRELARPGTARPSSCPAALEQIIPNTPSYRKLRRARMVRVRPEPTDDREVLVTQRFADGRLVDVLVRRQARRWLLVLNPYSPLG